MARRVGVGCLGAAGFGITGFDESFWGTGRERRRTRPVASTTRAGIPRGAASEVDRERESGSRVFVRTAPDPSPQPFLAGARSAEDAFAGSLLLSRYSRVGTRG